VVDGAKLIEPERVGVSVGAVVRALGAEGDTVRAWVTGPRVLIRVGTTLVTGTTGAKVNELGLVVDGAKLIEPEGMGVSVGAVVRALAGVGAGAVGITVGAWVTGAVVLVFVGVLVSGTTGAKVSDTRSILGWVEGDREGFLVGKTGTIGDEVRDTVSKLGWVEGDGEGSVVGNAGTIGADVRDTGMTVGRVEGEVDGPSVGKAITRGAEVVVIGAEVGTTGGSDGMVEGTGFGTPVNDTLVMAIEGLIVEKMEDDGTTEKEATEDGEGVACVKVDRVGAEVGKVNPGTSFTLTTAAMLRSSSDTTDWL
jgi:hypothetical protein